MTIYPEKYRENFRSVFDWLDKRPCARRRGLGTKLPFDKDWIIESLSDSTIYMAFYTVAHIIKNSKIKPEQLIPEFFDYIFLNSGNAKDLAKKSKIQKSILEKIKNEFEYWYPVDQRHTAIMHISNHLSFFIFHHVAIFPEKYWPRTITLIEPVIVEGVKMGKSKGNVIPLAKVQEDFGADVFRLYMSHQAEFGTKMDWKAAEVYSTKKQLERFYDMFLQLSENKKFKPTLQTEIFLSKFTRKIKESMDYINNFNLRKYMQVAFYDVMNEIIKYKENRITPEVLRQWLILLSPVIPHMCEELWEKLKDKEEFVSLAKWPKIDEKLIKPDIEEIEEYLDNLITDIEQVISLSKIKKPNIYLYTAEDWKWNILGILKNNKGDVGKTIKESINKYNEIDKSQITQFVQICAKKRLWDAELIKIKEEKVLKEQKGYLEKETGAKIYINEKTIIERRAKNRTTGEARQDYFKTDEKNKVSLPFKPAIYVE